MRGEGSGEEKDEPDRGGDPEEPHAQQPEHEPGRPGGLEDRQRQQPGPPHAYFIHVGEEPFGLGEIGASSPGVGHDRGDGDYVQAGYADPPILGDADDTRRIAVTVVGTVILAVGVVLLVAPGPGLVVIALALAVFAVEYEWARRNLAAVQERARSAALKAAASRVATASAVLSGVGAIGLGVVLIFTDLLPLSGVGTGIGAAVGGLTVLVTMVYGLREMRKAEKAEESEDAE